MKKVHMLRYHFSRRDNEDVELSLCKVHNKTWAYKHTTHWNRVTCENCLNLRSKSGHRVPRAEDL